MKKRPELEKVIKMIKKRHNLTNKQAATYKRLMIEFNTVPEKVIK